MIIWHWAGPFCFIFGIRTLTCVYLYCIRGAESCFHKDETLYWSWRISRFLQLLVFCLFLTSGGVRRDVSFLQGNEELNDDEGTQHQIKSGDRSVTFCSSTSTSSFINICQRKWKMKADSSGTAARLQAATLLNIYIKLTRETASMKERPHCHPDTHNDVCVCLPLGLEVVFAVIQKLLDSLLSLLFGKNKCTFSALNQINTMNKILGTPQSKTQIYKLQPPTWPSK